MPERVLLLFNRTSGTGQSPPLIDRVVGAFRKALDGGADLTVVAVDGHPASRETARAFFSASEDPCVIVAGGGGGTLRAVVEGVCDGSAGRLPGARRLRLGALRLGSGNVVAKRFGVPLDPLEGARAVASSVRVRRSAPCAVLRCRFGTADGGMEMRHAVTMCGLGQFGRTSGDLARWHRFLGRRRQALVTAAGIERVNDLEYVAAAAGRLAASLVYPPLCERVEAGLDGRRERFRLLAGVVMNFPIRGIPFDPGVEIGEAAAGVRLLPLFSRPRAGRIERGRGLSLRLLDRQSVEFFLDEDPERAYRELNVEVAGILSFLPGRAA